MKRLTYIFVLLLISGGLFAQGFTVNFTPKSLKVNKLDAVAIDPINPDAQPHLTTLTVSNSQSAPAKAELQVQVKWNSTWLVKEGEAMLRTVDPIAPNAPLVISNRDLLTNVGGFYLESDMDIDIVDAAEANPLLKEALLAGYFPDGTLEFHVSVRALGSTTWDDSDVFKLTIKNAGAIYPVSPGKHINQVPPLATSLPQSFIWNAVATGFNDQYLVIKEFPPSQIPNSNSVETSGSVVYRSPSGVQSGFAEYIPFNNGCFYAWQVYMPLFDGFNPLEEVKADDPGLLKSPWYVFKYAEDGNTGDADEISGLLNGLKNTLILNILMQGYKPTGEVWYNGRSYSGQEALDLIESLRGKNFTVEIKD
ncbi:MAG: hypothetical protein KBB33_01140 [Candidatus Cloacimonetes bacterium]|nr:hypothetical protein [Candidatus Cloacimonadota bacterium]